MKKLIRRISAAVLAAAMAMGALMTSASASYHSYDVWNISYVNQLPNNPGNTCTAKSTVHGNGYKTWCEKIGGGNDRVVFVKAPYITEFRIAERGYSSDLPYNKNQENPVIFTFRGSSASTCIANGTVGYIE